MGDFGWPSGVYRTFQFMRIDRSRVIMTERVEDMFAVRIQFFQDVFAFAVAFKSALSTIPARESSSQLRSNRSLGVRYALSVFSKPFLNIKRSNRNLFRQNMLWSVQFQIC